MLKIKNAHNLPLRDNTLNFPSRLFFTYTYIHMLLFLRDTVHAALMLPPFVSETLFQRNIYFICSVKLSPPRTFSKSLLPVCFLDLSAEALVGPCRPNYSRPSISTGSYLQTQPTSDGKDLKTKVTLGLTGAM